MAVEFLTRLFNRILEGERMPEEFSRSVLLPIFKHKGDVQTCSNYRGIKLISHTKKLWERVVEARGQCDGSEVLSVEKSLEREGSGGLRLQGEEVEKVEEFRYLGSTVKSNGECVKEVKKRVQAGWSGWRRVTGVICDSRVSARMKGKVYKTVVRPAMLYGLETVALSKRQEVELKVAELKMLRFSLGVTTMDKIRNEFIRGTAHVGCFGDKVREARFRCFGHVQRRDMNYIGRKMLKMEPPVGSLADKIGPMDDDANTVGKELNTVTLECSYETSSDRIWLHWYKQYPNSTPQFVLLKVVQIIAGAVGSSITPEQTIISSPEHSNTTLTCTYDDSAEYLHWYRQKRQSGPEFLLMISKTIETFKRAEHLEPQISIRLHKGKKKVDLEIFPAAVSDSALYYCAMEPTVKQNSYTLYKK
ncbi:hypothetical protein C0J50_9541 [Silurus asotus]|uniref:Ig-like domain-containing protein n=1 Tax=Silurus asotus TaxID=30991 RepID=A0AAD5A2S6_SILAS|nr:hypothetical protein C0J50_9541 [Silurus asotus]